LLNGSLNLISFHRLGADAVAAALLSEVVLLLKSKFSLAEILKKALDGYGT